MQVHLILAFVALLWGLNPPAMKIGLLYVEPMPYNAIRMVIALVVGWPVLQYVAKWQSLRREDWKVLFISSLGFFFFQVFLTAGLQLTTAGNASLILGCLPVSIAMINYFHRFESVGSAVIIGIVVSLSGVAIMVAGTGNEISVTDGHIFGALMILIAQISYGYYTVFSRQLLHIYSAYQITAYVLLYSTGLFLLISLPSIFATQWQSIPSPGWISVIYSAIFPLCLGNCLWIWGTGILGSTKASLYNNLPPIFSVTVGYFFLGESFGWLQFLGALIIFAGLYITRSKPITTSIKEGSTDS